jgi:plasmid stabilization system protein ParE
VNVRWTSPALRDLEIIGDHIERENSAAVAARIVTAIFDHADNLAKFPDIGRPGRIPGTRELVIVDTPFIVPYRVRDAEVEILAVFHGARLWPEKFD